MNEYSYKDIDVGLKEQFEVVINEKMVKAFGEITGDFNPLHIDTEFAVKKGYSQCVVYGMLTSSFLSTLAGMYLPGKMSLIHSVAVKFLKPVYIGDRLWIEGLVEEKHDLFHLLTVKVTIVNQKKEKVVKGNMKVGFLDE